MTNDLNATPHANRTHIAIFGRCNSGKSSLINAITNQSIAIVSDVKGTTTDPVYKAMEISGIGPCVLVDTAGFDDQSTKLSAIRVKKTKDVIDKTNIAVLVLDAFAFSAELEQNGFCDFAFEKKWLAELVKSDVPVIVVLNKSDCIASEKMPAVTEAVRSAFSISPLWVSAKAKGNLESLFEALKHAADVDEVQSITGHLVGEDDVVLLIMPQDIQAPKGRLILPQVQTIRDLLDSKAIVISATFDKAPKALASLKEAPKLIITDSQIFKEVAGIKPEQSLLTSFSVLFARYKGDEGIYTAGAHHIDKLHEGCRVLIAESCTHTALDGDIARVKLPALLRKKVGKALSVDVVSGAAFPDDLQNYDLIIQCGGCMTTRKHMLSRIKKAQEHNVAITNYGIAIAKLTNTMYV